jgi:hypothetical protein
MAHRVVLHVGVVERLGGRDGTTTRGPVRSVLPMPTSQRRCFVDLSGAGSRWWRNWDACGHRAIRAHHSVRLFAGDPSSPLRYGHGILRGHSGSTRAMCHRSGDIASGDMVPHGTRRVRLVSSRQRSRPIRPGSRRPIGGVDRIGSCRSVRAARHAHPVDRTVGTLQPGAVRVRLPLSGFPYALRMGDIGKRRARVPALFKFGLHLASSNRGGRITGPGSRVSAKARVRNFAKGGTVLAVLFVWSAMAAGCTGTPAGSSLANVHSPTLHPTPPPRVVTTVPTLPGVVPTVATAPTDCQSGSASVAAPSTGSHAVCLHVGATLTVTFDKSGGGMGVPGPWLVPPVRMDRPIIAITSTSPHGPLLTAVFRAESPGSTTVYASFGEECSKGDKTPCTVPPLGMIELDVTVVSP